MRRRAVQVVRALAPLGMVVAACSTAAPPASLTWKIDCVSVLGIPTPSGQTPLAAVAPPAGVPRDVRIGDLTDAELAGLRTGKHAWMGGYAHELLLRYTSVPARASTALLPAHFGLKRLRCLQMNGPHVTRSLMAEDP